MRQQYKKQEEYGIIKLAYRRLYMRFIPITPEIRDQVNNFIDERWLGTAMAVRGRLVYMTELAGVAAYEGDALAGLVMYMIENGECEIISLDSVREGQGTGTRLIEAVIDKAREAGCSKVKLISTNDNTEAMKFYQKRGFDMARIYRNAVEESRKLKPSIPLTGENGITIKHEIEFEYILR
jgi:GNAT superfamily N-acetyltransferase